MLQKSRPDASRVALSNSPARRRAHLIRHHLTQSEHPRPRYDPTGRKLAHTSPICSIAKGGCVVLSPPALEMTDPAHSAASAWLPVPHTMPKRSPSGVFDARTVMDFVLPANMAPLVTIPLMNRGYLQRRGCFATSYNGTWSHDAPLERRVRCGPSRRRRRGKVSAAVRQRGAGGCRGVGRRPAWYRGR
jgi:hypothetical protein